jgi:hypothetical protein
MTLITLQDGKLVLRDGKVGTEQACCCGGGTGACCYSEAACPRSLCEDVVGPQTGYWIQLFPPGSPNNTRPSPLWQCEFIGPEDDSTELFSDGCYAYRQQDLQAGPNGLCFGQPWGFSTVWACETNGGGLITRCADGVTASFCESNDGFFFAGETCEDKEFVNGSPGCGLEGPYYPFSENEFP